MRVICPHCSHKAMINSSNAMSATVKDLYCTCTNVEACGARFVFTLSYARTINPPAGTVKQMAYELVNSMSKEEKAEMQRNLSTRPG